MKNTDNQDNYQAKDGQRRQKQQLSDKDGSNSTDDSFQNIQHRQRGQLLDKIMDNNTDNNDNYQNNQHKRTQLSSTDEDISQTKDRQQKQGSRTAVLYS